MNRFITTLFLLFTAIISLHAQSHWSFEAQGAEAYNLPIPLIIKQEGYPNIKMTAHYFTEPLTLPVYYDLRLGRWQKGKSWELEMIHHKLYLDNTTSEITKFNISHGFNLFFVNRGIQLKSFHYRAGAGFVITHPESNVRGREFEFSTDQTPWGYFLSGPAVQMAVSRPFYLGDKFFINVEAKTTAGYANVRIAQGRADVYNIAFHLLIGVGIDFLHKP